MQSMTMIMPGLGFLNRYGYTHGNPVNATILAGLIALLGATSRGLAF